VRGFSANIFELPFIDYDSLHISDIYIYATYFGVERARATLLTEIQNILKFDGANIEPRYLRLLCDVMTRSGKLESISCVQGVLTNLLFEKEVKKINHASMIKLTDECVSVESSVFLGHAAKLGTGGFDTLDSGKANGLRR